MRGDFDIHNLSFWRIAYKISAAVITLASLLWVISLLLRVWPDLLAHSGQIETTPLLCGLVLSLASAYLTFEAYAILAHILRIKGLKHRELAHLYFTSQLLKHLPGRVWGFGYHWALGRTAGSASDWILVNLGHMLLATFFALCSAVAAIGFLLGLGLGLTATAWCVAVYLASWKAASSRMLSKWIARLPGRAGTLGSATLAFLAQVPPSTRGRVCVIFATSSFLYYLGWGCYGSAYPPLGADNGMRLGAMYLLAWFIGYISLLTPSGLGVRELTFAWLAKDFPGETVALMAVIGRLSLLFVDLLLGLAFAPFIPRKS